MRFWSLAALAPIVLIRIGGQSFVSVIPRNDSPRGCSICHEQGCDCRKHLSHEPHGEPPVWCWCPHKLPDSTPAMTTNNFQATAGLIRVSGTLLRVDPQCKTLSRYNTSPRTHETYAACAARENPHTPSAFKAGLQSRRLKVCSGFVRSNNGYGLDQIPRTQDFIAPGGTVRHLNPRHGMFCHV